MGMHMMVETGVDLDHTLMTPREEGSPPRGPSLPLPSQSSFRSREAAATHASPQLTGPGAPNIYGSSGNKADLQTICSSSITCCDDGPGLRTPLSSSKRQSVGKPAYHDPPCLHVRATETEIHITNSRIEIALKTDNCPYAGKRKDSCDSNVAACRQEAPCVHSRPSPTPIPTSTQNNQHLHRDHAQHLQDDIILCPANHTNGDMDIDLDINILGTATSSCHVSRSALDNLLFGIGAWTAFS